MVERPVMLTEQELPRGAMMVVGRSLDGELLAVMLPEDDLERTAKIVGALRKVSRLLALMGYTDFSGSLVTRHLQLWAVWTVVSVGTRQPIGLLWRPMA